MDPISIHKLLKDLREELKNVQDAISALERLSAGMGNRRGRPPLWLSEAKQRKQLHSELIEDRPAAEFDEVSTSDEVPDSADQAS